MREIQVAGIWLVCIQVVEVRGADFGVAEISVFQIWVVEIWTWEKLYNFEFSITKKKKLGKIWVVF